MAIRIRETGELLCAAHTEPMKGDTYLNDDIHYYLSQLSDAIKPSKTHKVDNLWFWNIQKCNLDHYADMKNYKNNL